MLDKISVVIIVKDGGKTIEKTLNALGQFSDVVVFDVLSVFKFASVNSCFKNTLSTRINNKMINHHTSFQGGVLEEECSQIISDF